MSDFITALRIVDDVTVTLNASDIQAIEPVIKLYNGENRECSDVYYGDDRITVLMSLDEMVDALNSLDPGGGGGGGRQVQANWTETDPHKVSYIRNKPTIPSRTSQLANDSGFITEDDIPPQVQADWNENDPTDPSYIQNKPAIPGGQVNADWEAESGPAMILHKPHIPDRTSDLNNDSGFITGEDVPANQAQANWDESNPDSPSYIQNKPAIPPGQVQADWNETDPADPSYIQNKPTIPTNTSDLNNDSGFITGGDVPANQEQSDWNETNNADPAYIKNKPSIPSRTSQLVNDAGFITISDVPQSDWDETDPTSPSYIQNKPTIPPGQVQADWNETDPNDPSYIQNKPTIPANTSDLNNDSGFITGGDVPANQEQSDWNETNNADPAYIKNKPSIPEHLSDLSDVTITNPSNNQILKYDTSSSSWINTNIGTLINLAVDTDYNRLIDDISHNVLVPGMLYRITDYVTTTVQTSTQSAGHPFDLIVMATAINKIDCRAMAVLHHGDSYFSGCDLSKWRIWYDINNDDSLYAWADTSTGKGVIYRMIDEWNNDCPYDFKNIQFRVPMTDGAYDSNGSSVWAFTFNYWDAGVRYDYSIVYQSGSSVVKENVIMEDMKSDGLELRRLNRNVFLANDRQYFVVGNRIGVGANRNYFGNGCNYNIVGNRCSNVIIGDNCEGNNIGDNCNDITLDNGNLKNIIGTECSKITAYDDCTNNYIGNKCSNISLGKGCIYNHIDFACNDVNLDADCINNVIGPQCTKISFKGTCTNNIFDSSCNDIFIAGSANTFGPGCDTVTLSGKNSNNSFGSGCSRITLAENSNNNTFGNLCSDIAFADTCSSNSFGPECTTITLTLSGYNVFESGCSGITMSGCVYNSFGSACNLITLDKKCDKNTFEDACSGITLSSECQSNSFGPDCNNITFGKGCSYNSFGPGNSSIELKGSNNANVFGNYIGSITLYSKSSNNFFGNECNKIILDQTCINNHFESGCNNINLGPNNESFIFHSGCHHIYTTNKFGEYIRNVIVGTGCGYINLYRSGIMDSSHYLQNIYIAQGVSGTTNNYIDIITIERALEYRTTVAMLISGTLRIYNEDEEIPASYVSVTYSGLVSAIGNNDLEPGTQYRITDYYATTVQTDTQSASNRFDLVVTATSNNTIDCKAKALLHSGDTYFSASGNTCDLSKWEIWYDINNDTNKYAWADSSNGRGVIYRMIDDLGNDCPYDFKSIQFRRKLTNGSYNPNSGVNTWVYTFSIYSSGNILDSTLNKSNNIYSNIQREYINNYKITLNDNVFLGEGCCNNSFKNNCYGNTLGGRCHNTIFGNYCTYNTFAGNCNANIFGNYCQNNSFGTTCVSNTFGNNCQYITFGSGCRANTFGDDCNHITFGNSSNQYGDYCRYNIIRNNCQYIRLYKSGAASVSNSLQFIYIAQSVQGTSSNYVEISTIDRALAYRTTVGMLTDGTLRIYKEDEGIDVIDIRRTT